MSFVISYGSQQPISWCYGTFWKSCLHFFRCFLTGIYVYIASDIEHITCSHTQQKSTISDHVFSVYAFYTHIFKLILYILMNDDGKKIKLLVWSAVYTVHAVADGRVQLSITGQMKSSYVRKVLFVVILHLYQTMNNWKSNWFYARYH